MLDTKAIVAALAPVMREHVEKATAPLLERIGELERRAPEKGEPGQDGIDGRDGEPGAPGKDAEPVSEAQIAEAVKAYLEANPPAEGRDGIDGKDGEPGAPGEKGEPGKDGADGVGLAGAMIDREGGLVITLTNGEAKSLGVVAGRDGVNGERGPAGFSLDDFDVNLKSDGRTVELIFVQGEKAFTRELALPTMIYRGIWQEGQEYERGDTVTWAGSLWHCDGGEAKGQWSGTTKDKPGEGSKAWTLAAKRGRDGKDFHGPVEKAPARVKVA